MRDYAKQIATTIAVLLGAAAAVVGLLLDIPTAIEKYGQGRFQWPSSADVWWVLSIGLITVVALLLIWRPGRADSAGFFPRAVTEKLKVLEKLASNLLHQGAPARLLHEIEVGLPAFVRARYGKEAGRHFRDALAAADQKGRAEPEDLRAARQYLAAIAFIDSCESELFEGKRCELEKRALDAMKSVEGRRSEFEVKRFVASRRKERQ